MPHQLRRIVAINIRNPKDGLPSGRVAELDPRGGVLAVGDNGVGKTTFLRLLPLFYGATPQQILRGTGLASMVAHTLPDASSAVAFEYERETPGDLRCAVMHCRPGEDAAQFHFIHGGYREEFFYDAQNQFVPREEFKARVEALGVQVSRKLLLNQYRSVILNERQLTKEGAELRRLAAVYSLGPAPLYNLDQIAAAMANEKISFRDLQNIVIEQVSDAQGDAHSAAGSRELRRNRDDVSRWLDDRNHLARILAEKPRVDKTLARIGRVNGLHLELCTLSVAVSAALGQAERELAELDARQHRLATDAEARQAALAESMAAATGEQQQALQAWHALRDEVQAADARLAHFQAIGAEALAAEQQFEESLKAEKSAREVEADALAAASGGVARSAQARTSALQAAAQGELGRIDARRLDASRQNAARAEALREDEAQALQALVLPERLQEIGAERNQLLSRLGELKVLVAHPLPGGELVEKRRAAAAHVARLDEDSRRAAKAVTTASEEFDKARRTADASLEHVRAAELRQRQHAQRMGAVQAQLAPPVGTLLAFLRGRDTALWSDAAKLMDPALLARTQLKPELIERLDEGAMPATGRLCIGALALDTRPVEVPSWVEMKDVREQVARLKVEAAALMAAVKEAQARALALRHEMNHAQVRLSKAIASESLAEAALENAQQTLTRLDRAVEQEREEARQGAVAESADTQARLQALQAEEQSLQRGLGSDRARIQDGFRQQRQALAAELQAAEAHLAWEKSAVQTRLADELRQVEDDAARELAGQGVDPARLARLARDIAALALRLDGIARQRHEVADWQRFRIETLPLLDARRQERDRREARCGEMAARLAGLRAEQEALAQRARHEAGVLDGQRLLRQREKGELQELLRRGLKDFDDHAPERLETDWNVAALKGRVERARTALAQQSDELEKDSRFLRGILVQRSGPVEHWLQLREAGLPLAGTLPEHQLRCAQAQAVCDWFDPLEHGPYVDQLHKEMAGFLAVASNFVRDLELFERRVEGFNRDLQKALSATERFERFRDLSVMVRSGVGQFGPMKLLRQMQERHQAQAGGLGALGGQAHSLPGDDEAALVRDFRDMLPADGVLRVNLNEQVRLECSLVENGRRRNISNEADFRSVSSNGNTALITAMFLMGFVQMIRGADSPVRLTWVTDEIGRFDPNNLGAFLHTLDMHRIDVISASPSVDPALARFFPRLCIFEETGAIATCETPGEGELHVNA